MKKLMLLCALVCMAIYTQAQYVAPIQLDKASGPQKVVGEALTKTGVISLSTGVPCLAIGAATLMCANFLPNPMVGYTTSATKANANKDLQLISVEEYNTKLREYTDLTHALEMTGYILTPMGAALTIVGIPLYVHGKKMLQLDIQYTGNGAGVALNF